jgi:hypothetical protein
MVAPIRRIEFPELFFGFVSPIGTDLLPVVAEFRRYFEGQGYRVAEIKATDVFPLLARYIPPLEPLRRSPLHARYKSHIGYGNQLRMALEDDAILALLTVHRNVRQRLR